ncbi:MAG: ribosome small subunit-dependent GTPase A [Clostridiales bacterium]|nr:ribosome small subunit-dependent GTPase A [Clostridiales bacterium]
MHGVITKGVGGLYTVRNEDGINVSCRIRGGLRHKKLTPFVGDKVEIGDSGDPDVPFVLEKICPRKNNLVRPPLANIDLVLLAFAVSDPEPDLKLLDKMLIVCNVLSIEPVIIFTKADLDPDHAMKLHLIYSSCGYKCFISSHDYRVGDEVTSLIGKDQIAAFAGPSGVGKSTLCNHFLDDDNMEVGSISERLKRGKHTTRHVELFELGEGFITDTPGFTSLDLFELGIDFDRVIGGYPELIEASTYCRFKDCKHLGERDCHVKDLIEKGDPSIDKDRYLRYKEFYENLYQRRNDYSVKRL